MVRKQRQVAERLEDVAFASVLVPARGAPAEDRLHEGEHFDAQEWTDLEASRARLDECAVTSTTVSGGRLRRARLTDVWLHEVRLVGVDLAESRWTDVTLVGCSLAGVEAYEAQWKRVVLIGCKLDSVNLRGARLEGVVLRDCMLGDVDLSGAQVEDLSVPGSRVERLHLRESRKRLMDLRGAASLDIVDGFEDLHGVVVDYGQAVELAPALARAVGLEVRAPAT